MTDQNFFFRWIWRLNALGLLAVLAFTIATAGPWIVRDMFSTTTEISAEPDAQPPSATLPNELFLDYAMHGRTHIVLALAPRAMVPEYRKLSAATRHPAQGWSIQAADRTRIANYLFIDPATGEDRWLFPTNDQTITATDYAHEGEWTSDPNVRLPSRVAGSDRPSTAALYEVWPRTKSPGVRAALQLYAAKSDGTKLTKLLGDLDEPPLENVQGDMLIVRYVTKGRQMVATFSLADFRPIMTKDVTDLAK